MEFTTEIAIRLILAAFLGGLIGLERTLAGKSAGVRTFALVALGAASFVLVSYNINKEFLGMVSFDPSRVIAAIVSGIGFIGAGVIFVKREFLKGLTTAAGLWTTAGVGVACGLGYVSLGFFVTALVLIIFTFVWALEQKFKKKARKRNGQNEKEEKLI